MSPDDIELAPAPGMKRSERTEVMIQRAKELAAQGRHYQTIELLLVMEGFAEATELLSQALIGELRRTAEAARKERAQPGGQPQVPDGSHDVSTTCGTSAPTCLP